jgi:hypothetical protein
MLDPIVQCGALILHNAIVLPGNHNKAYRDRRGIPIYRWYLNLQNQTRVSKCVNQ